MEWLSRHQKHIHGVMALAWLAASPVVVFTDLRSSVPFLVFISVYAVVVGHWGGWAAERESPEQKG